MLKHGDILHFNAKGIYKLTAGFNHIRTALYLEIEGEKMVAIYEKNELKLMQLFAFSKRFNYVASRPIWVTNPSVEILQHIGMKFKNESVLFAEIIGFSNFWLCRKDDILKLCIANNWLVTE